jgi:hypothetical protein
MVKQAMKDDQFKNVRFLYLSVKAEDYFGVKPTTSINQLFRTISKERLAVYYPPAPEDYEVDVDDIIEEAFQMVEENADAEGGPPRFVIMIDDVNVLDGFSSRGVVSKSVKKLVVAGRSKGISGCFLCHRLGNLPRLMNGNLSGLVVMNINPMDNDYARKIFGVDFDAYVDELGDYRWLYVDLIDESTSKYAPVPAKI